MKTLVFMLVNCKLVLAELVSFILGSKKPLKMELRSLSVVQQIKIKQ